LTDSVTCLEFQDFLKLALLALAVLQHLINSFEISVQIFNFAGSI